MATRCPAGVPALILVICIGCPGEKPSGGDDTVAGESDSPVDTACDQTSIWYTDRDHDGYGDDGAPIEACEAPAGAASVAGDCDDGDEDVHPGADETCEDAVDQDCDGEDPACSDPAGPEGLDGATVKLWDTERGADAGRHLMAGDLTGDGAPDLAVSEMWVNSYRGGVFVLSPAIAESGPLDEAGIELLGDAGSFEGGRSLGVGDTTGDGYDDLLIGSPDATSYDAVIFAGPLDTSMSFDDADVLAFCTPSIECGHGAAIADLTGDGIDDALVGAGEEVHDGVQMGSIYVFAGPVEGGTYDIRADASFELSGSVMGEEAGRIVNGGGDLDGDGVEDALITAGQDSETGVSLGTIYVVLGPIAEDTSLDESAGQITGGSAYSYAGEALGMADLDGDGDQDALIGAYAASGRDGAAAAFTTVVEGSTSLNAAEIQILGEDGESMGISLAGADLDGDGPGELLVGAASDDTADRAAGAAFLYQGPLSGSYGPSDAARIWTGEKRQDAAGSGVGLMDLSGDGQIDVLIGAPGESSGAKSGGSVYLINY